MQVSESTVRRDLDRLEENGAAKRTHGGVFYTGSSPNLPHFDIRQSLSLQKKKEIAQAAAELIDDGDSILLDGGTTTYELAQLLVGRHVHVVTNSLPVANLFASAAESDLVLIGGYILHRTGVAVGPTAAQMLADLRVRRAMLSVASVAEGGFFNNNLLIVEAERAMMRAADEVIVLADSTKFGHQSLAQLCELSEVDKIVSDHELADHWRATFEQAGGEAIIAAPFPSAAKSESLA